MADYSRETMQAMREIAQELRCIRKTLEGIDRRLATSGGLTNATTRRAHIIHTGETLLCSACGKVIGYWSETIDDEIMRGMQCAGCCAIFTGEVVQA